MTQAPSDARAFLERAFDQPADWLTSFALAARKLPREPLAVGEDQELAWLSGSPFSEAARVALLLRMSASQSDLPGVLAECFRQGDNGEKRAVLRSLALMPSPDELVEVGTFGCRTNVVTVFEAIACENPFAAKYFPEPSFNQMVLKAVFVGVSLSRVMGLNERLNPDLSRMAQDYAAERRAAGRSVPSDLELIVEGGRP